jgi:hypothetical protein
MAIQDRIASIWEKIKASPAVTRARISIPNDHIIGGQPARALPPNEGYFTVVVNEMFLTHEREWVSKYDPLVTVVSEFIYDSEMKTVPVVVGPALLQEGLAENTPVGMTYRNTRAAGPHPFRGGRLILTVILSRVQRTDHAKDLLNLVQLGGKALDYASALSPYLKVAEVLTNGVESILGLDGTRPVIGHREEHDADAPGGFVPGYFAMFDLPENDVKANRLWVKGNRLFEGDSADTAKPFTRGDFVLYSVSPAARRSDFDLLPLAPLHRRVMREANTAVAGAWDNAKVSLATLIQDARESPDLSKTHREELIAEWKVEAKKLHTEAEEMATLSRGPVAIPIAADEARTRKEALDVLRM